VNQIEISTDWGFGWCSGCDFLATSWSAFGHSSEFMKDKADDEDELELELFYGSDSSKQERFSSRTVVSDFLNRSENYFLIFISL